LTSRTLEFHIPMTTKGPRTTGPDGELTRDCKPLETISSAIPESKAASSQLSQAAVHVLDAADTPAAGVGSRSGGGGATEHSNYAHSSSSLPFNTTNPSRLRPPARDASKASNARFCMGSSTTAGGPGYRMRWDEDGRDDSRSSERRGLAETHAGAGMGPGADRARGALQGEHRFDFFFCHPPPHKKKTLQGKHRSTQI
jgi:hypothetical protein